MDKPPKLDSSHSAGLYPSMVPFSQGDQRLGECEVAHYPQLQQFRSVPVCHVEVRRLARFVPIAFGDLGGQMQPIALPYSNKRFVSARTAALLGTNACPVLLRAFPLALGPRIDDDKVAVAIDQPNLTPGEIVQLAFAPDGALTASFTTKVDYLWLFAATRRATLEMTEAAQVAGALTPWSITFDFDEGDALAAPDIFTIDPRFVESADYLSLVQRFGVAVVNLVEGVLLSQSHLGVSDAGQTGIAA